jgi:hypothetical protein
MLAVSPLPSMRIFRAKWHSGRFLEIPYAKLTGSLINQDLLE